MMAIVEITVTISTENRNFLFTIYIKIIICHYSWNQAAVAKIPKAHFQIRVYNINLKLYPSCHRTTGYSTFTHKIHIPIR